MATALELAAVALASSAGLTLATLGSSLACLTGGPRSCDNGITPATCWSGGGGAGADDFLANPVRGGAVADATANETLACAGPSSISSAIALSLSYSDDELSSLSLVSSLEELLSLSS